MEINITKQPTKIIAVNKKTKERKDVNLLHIGSRTFNCADESTWEHGIIIVKEVIGIYT